MSEVHIPLVRGEHAEIDAKLLPQGALSKAQNVRFEKDARMVSRLGYAVHADAPGTAANYSAEWAKDRSLHFYSRSAGPAKFREVLPATAWTTAATSSAGTTTEAPIRNVAVQRTQYTVGSCDTAYANGYLLCVYDDFDISTSAQAGLGALQYVVYHQATMRQVASGTIISHATSAGLTARYYNALCIALSTDICIVYRKDNQMRMTVFHTTNLTTDDYSLGVYSLSATAEAQNHQRSFDICPYDSTHIALCLEYIVTSTSQGIKAYSVTNTGTVVEFISTTGFGTSDKRVGICRIENGTYTERYLVSSIDSAGTAKIAAYNNGGSLITSITTVGASNAKGAPCSGTSAVEAGILCWAVAGGPAGSGKMVVWKYNGLTGTTIPSLFPAGKPFTTPDGGDCVWTVDRTEADNIEQFGTYKLVDCYVHSVDVEAGGVVCDAVCAQEQALCGAAYPGNPPISQLRHTVTVDIDTAKAEKATYTGLPILVGAQTWPMRADFVEMHYGPFVHSCYPARLNGQLFLSGARLREFDGSQLYESGLAQGPQAITSSTSTSGGPAIPAGTYNYKVIWKWIDAAGRIHRSQPSLNEIVSTVATSKHTLTIEPPPFTARTANSRPTLFAEVYRTKKDGTVYFLVNPFVRATFNDGLLSTTLTFLDNETDANISDNETLYTEGDILDNEEPPPCRFIVAGENRLLLAGLEDPSAYRFSKKVTPGLAVSFTTDTSFGGSVDGTVTGVGHLDGVFYVGTRDAIFAIAGDGPDDLGDGTFNPPRALPADCGFESQKSIVETPAGLMYQGSNNRIYLLPRGGGSPQWIGQPVRDALALFPLISWSRFIPEQNIAVFCCLARTASTTDTVLLVYDTRIGEWVRDVWLPSDPGGHGRLWMSGAVRNGKLFIDGRFLETGYADKSALSDNYPITWDLITGDIRPFGVQGDGRVRSITLLGEKASVANITVEVSRDSGANWDTPAGSWLNYSLYDVRYDLPKPRGLGSGLGGAGGYRFRIRATPTNVGTGATEPGASAVINSISLEVFPAAGLARLGSGAKR